MILRAFLCLCLEALSPQSSWATCTLYMPQEPWRGPGERRPCTCPACLCICMHYSLFCLPASTPASFAACLTPACFLFCTAWEGGKSLHCTSQPLTAAWALTVHSCIAPVSLPAFSAPVSFIPCLLPCSFLWPKLGWTSLSSAPVC